MGIEPGYHYRNKKSLHELFYSWREGVMNATHSQGIIYSLTITNIYVNTVNYLLCSRQGRLKAYLYYSDNTVSSYSYFLPY